MKKILFVFIFTFTYLNSFAMDMLSIKGNWFKRSDGKTVYVSSFEISPYEVTHDKFLEFIKEEFENLDKYDKGFANPKRCADELGYNPDMFVYESKWPQINISFYTSLMFCNWLSRKERLEPVYKIDKTSKFYKVEWNKILNGYRLPTETEWEYAAGCGGTDKRMYDKSSENLKKIANAHWVENTGAGLQVCGSKSPNNWGLFDVLGSVWEWCWDYHNDYPIEEINPSRDDKASVDKTLRETGKYDGTEDRVIRGGSINSYNRLEECSVNYRGHASPWLRTYGMTGLRLVRNAPDSTVFTFEINDNNVRIRKTPGLLGAIIKTYDKGTSLEVISKKYISDKDSFPWCLVRTKSNKIGWVYGEFISAKTID